MLITKSQVSMLAPDASAEIVEGMVPEFNTRAGNFGIVNHLRLVHFMAQTCEESAGFTRLEENLVYTHADRIATVWPRLAAHASSLVRNPIALANAAYSDRNGNGDEASGDGYIFRGSGILQLTGRREFEEASNDLGLPLLEHPGLVRKPMCAMLTALWYWRRAGCNEAADADDVEHVTRLINGPALAGLERRKELTQRAKGIFR